MRRVHELMVRRSPVRPLAAALLAAGLVALWGCESSTQFNIEEYERIRARRRAELAQRMAQQAPAEKPAVAKPAAQPEQRPAKRSRAADTPKAAPAEREPAAPAKKPAAAPAAVPEPVPAEEPLPVVEEPVPAVEEPPAAPAEPAPVPAEEEPVVEEPAPVADPEPEPPAEIEVPPAEPVVEVIAPPSVPVAVPEPPPPPQAPSAPAAAPAPVRPAAMGVYTLARGDIVQITLRGIPEAQLIEDSVDEYGMVSLPFINEVAAEGLTSSELEQRIRNQYRDEQIYPNVTVSVQVPTRYYYMQGEIRAPGKVQLISATRLSQAIAASGGGTEFWNGKVFLRRNGDIVRTIKNARRLEKSPEDDILLEPGDIVELDRGIF